MKPLITLFLTLIFSTVTVAQTGINYKALIKDTNGNVVANSTVTVQFTILQGAAQTNVYQESHAPSTDANGLIIINIGEGTPINGTFNTIDWASNNTFLNTKIDTGTGLTDMGTTGFKTVPYAINAQTANNVAGLEAINEGNGIGWRLKGRNPQNYGNIGSDAVDLSYSGISSETYGATKSNSTTMGYQTTASGDFASTAMGYQTTASGDYASTAMGYQTTASGETATSMGYNTIASGENSTAMGEGTNSASLNSLAIGRYNIGGGTPRSWIETDPLFEVGNGTGDASRSNALTVLKNGTITAPSFDIAEITDNKALITKEYADLNLKSSGLEAIDEGNGIGWRLKGRNSAYYGNIGKNAVDLSYNDSNSETHGATGTASLSSGTNNIASEWGSVAMGTYNEASGFCSIAMGSQTTATGYNSIAMGYKTISNENYLTVIGRWNSPIATSIFQVGDGGSLGRSNAFTIMNNGDAYLRGGLAQFSDRRLKKDISPLAYGLETILALNPVAYNWKRDTQEHKSLGLIAQEVQPIIKEIVTEVGDERQTLGINYIELIPVLIKAIQEQQEIINNQDSKINDLSAEIDQLKGINSKVKKANDQ